jgi:hypothetical protein
MSEDENVRKGVSVQLGSLPPSWIGLWESKLRLAFEITPYSQTFGLSPIRCPPPICMLDLQALAVSSSPTSRILHGGGLQSP